MLHVDYNSGPEPVRKGQNAPEVGLPTRFVYE